MGTSDREKEPKASELAETHARAAETDANSEATPPAEPDWYTYRNVAKLSPKDWGVLFLNWDPEWVRSLAASMAAAQDGLGVPDEFLEPFLGMAELVNAAVASKELCPDADGLVPRQDFIRWATQVGLAVPRLLTLEGVVASQLRDDQTKSFRNGELVRKSSKLAPRAPEPPDSVTTPGEVGEVLVGMKAIQARLAQLLGEDVSERTAKRRLQDAGVSIQKNGHAVSVSADELRAKFGAHRRAR